MLSLTAVSQAVSHCTSSSWENETSWDIISRVTQSFRRGRDSTGPLREPQSFYPVGAIVSNPNLPIIHFRLKRSISSHADLNPYCSSRTHLTQLTANTRTFSFPSDLQQPESDRGSIYITLDFKITLSLGFGLTEGTLDQTYSSLSDLNPVWLTLFKPGRILWRKCPLVFPLMSSDCSVCLQPFISWSCPQQLPTAAAAVSVCRQPTCCFQGPLWITELRKGSQRTSEGKPEEILSIKYEFWFSKPWVEVKVT